ncbi:hypothetical protein ACFWNL_17450 [Kitasatospora sp. NPDC058397]|uniref:hypothetical protein n=1 Tax=unclassified Kitasatospora TaxID=2633591 RepID=UPI0036567F58
MTDKALPLSAPISVRPNPLLGMPLTAGGLLISLPKALDGGPTAPVYAAAAVVSALAPALVLLLSVAVGRGRITVRRGLHRTSVPLAELRSVTAEADAGRGPHTLLLESRTGAHCRIPLLTVRRRDRQRLVAALERTAPPGAVREDQALRDLLGLPG